jgi:hypothetical protein
MENSKRCKSSKGHPSRTLLLGRTTYILISLIVRSHQVRYVSMFEQTPSSCRHSDFRNVQKWREQLVGHELIEEALSKFMLLNVPHLSPSSRHESSSNFEAIVIYPKENQSYYR